VGFELVIAIVCEAGERQPSSKRSVGGLGGHLQRWRTPESLRTKP
jgi:hypothetical protein